MDSPLKIAVRSAVPTAEVHIDAVRAALRDGRLDVAVWAARIGVTEAVALLWADGEPIQESWAARAWQAAVTTTIPGWRTPRDATATTSD